MFFIGKNEKLVANVLYRDAIIEEKKWRKKEENINDVILLDELLIKLKKEGYNYQYLADITNRNNKDPQFLKIILEYIGLFDDESISAELVRVVGIRGNIAATEKILDNYINSSEKNKHMQAAFYDNALEKIKDTRYINNYLEILKNPDDAIKLPLTMIMLGKWKIEEAKKYFVKYLDAKEIYVNIKTSDLVFIALNALSYYTDLNDDILKKIENKLNSDDEDVRIVAKKTIKRIKIKK